jgi:predicted AAA+ superfamily ATPase
MYKRFVAAQLKTALEDTRVVLLSGPRQSGKTTLARQLAEDGMTFLTLDNATTLEAAKHDVVGFVRGIDRAVIDEVQRLPALLLAIKESVDADRRPGRFLLTGSANLMTLPRVADSLAGRTTTVQLLPLSQSEIRARPTEFLARVFQGKPPAIGQRVVAADLVATVLAGGYPEALGRTSWNRRHLWYRDYIDSIIQRDVRDIAEIDRIKDMSRLLRVLAHHSGQLVNYSGLGAPLNLSHTTARKYLAVFETIFLLRALDPWYSNELSRLVKTPKLFFLDSGLLAALRNLSPQRIAADRGLFGPVLETFVLGELMKLASWFGEPLDFFHFRDKEKNEVDIVIEDADRRVVGIEVKAAATATAADFRGLAKLQQACGKRFALGMVLYDHHQMVPFSEKLFAVPIAALWG